MTTLTMTFSEAAERSAPTKSLNASLHLLVADTRRGMDNATKAAFQVVSSNDTPSTQGYLQRYEAAAGHAAPAHRATATLKM